MSAGIPTKLITTRKTKCLTPGAEYMFEVKQQSTLNGYHEINFAVGHIPLKTMLKIDEKIARKLEAAFHKAIEPVLAGIWERTYE